MAGSKLKAHSPASSKDRISHHHSLWAARVHLNLPLLRLSPYGLWDSNGCSVPPSSLSGLNWLFLTFAPFEQPSGVGSPVCHSLCLLAAKSPAYWVSSKADRVCFYFSPPCSQLELVSRAVPLAFWPLSLPPVFPRADPSQIKPKEFAEPSLSLASPTGGVDCRFQLDTEPPFSLIHTVPNRSEPHGNLSSFQAQRTRSHVGDIPTSVTFVRLCSISERTFD